jgi:F0F1-type ATP synthase alpha subunit
MNYSTIDYKTAVDSRNINIISPYYGFVAANSFSIQFTHSLNEYDDEIRFFVEGIRKNIFHRIYGQ